MRFLIVFGLWLFISFPAWAFDDFFGRSLVWPAHPQRVVSLSPATTEMLYAVGASAQLIGVTSDCNYPVQARQKKQLGRFGNVPLETLVKLKPDLILVTADMKRVLAPLKRLKVPVLALETPSVAQIGRNLELMGQVTGHAPQGKQAAQAFQERLQRLRARIPHQKTAPRVFYLLWDQPLISAGSHSFIGDILNLAGAENAAPPSQAAFPHVSLEHLLRRDPDVLILPETVAPRIHLERPPFERLKAVKKGRILRINDDLISRPAPRVLDALELLIRFLYPRT
ncbi:hypothetical protein COW36_10525 [bacterium (Candidatus Blackallbacteria) CG17_big_fil_post_rev_8_21_14_2_50_48_46]|uniref:Fe/B12 periplasmic-binding domain-containing protein n=1 Tax=bacterium (Candidatus Blackallbacteria) CG17_big_fil_post_rev_8_21_14_2_50_48_46 TaxID=2014261 RepID=A0A2M7G650_9BACT|nr:MAG: hypothetical protein COW64_20300 [bacterium (Candidatus Blackallbacteria) CG18_big_fil_WC_8_21_14_2_50_49_26]PIW17065.1 MAG: hypothetical protein COW36_10525 [bacterium (Candidatus Blackallbacteria) CG17_big_fil_post_rev_8_21_14_2_50_48_46]PIW47700.1 MAG: hypothetical protein COW20_11695 [bacterium (Candidatus Blackallbacteria) CG13_big_fil_rev_8_21_14_2_50_49_14]